MTKTQRVRYESFLGVRDFGITYEEKFPKSSKAAEAFGHVAEAIAQIETQGQRRAHARQDGLKGKAEAKAALLQWMREVVRSARNVARTGAGSNASLRMPVRVSDVALLEAARVLLDRRRPFGAQFIELGLPTDWEASFKASIDAFDACLHSRRAGRSGIVNASADIAGALARGSSALRTLDVIVANSLKGEPAIVATWLRCREVAGRKSKPGALLAETTEPTASAAVSNDVLTQAS